MTPADRLLILAGSILLIYTILSFFFKQLILDKSLEEEMKDDFESQRKFLIHQRINRFALSFLLFVVAPIQDESLELTLGFIGLIPILISVIYCNIKYLNRPTAYNFKK